ncbi:uncharacterized protein RHOBADRAFT_56109 [Rhodotorula graminis WP1]|uniref:Pre-rRNA-processing protein n=1 Tax=Rhodotorula graminis (strain WP1) TaxID=578459 RepID=A0A0P9EYK9_RHOGW|nr:uncharacterized protein RHOBADRAFT_56109 [Rhodotorula graminis WP1]KPV72298.1 hypothetical protein RHOBADRAFT_56109 [Rhodotorula graminis WP1]
MFSSKHKKERKADFTKAKLKLGKGKAVAQNATNTSFAAKSIALPSQSLAATSKGAPVSRRNLTLPELLVHSRHYSVPVKREALHEIGQLVEQHPFLLSQHLLPLVTSLSHLVGDPSASVRAAVRTLLSTVADQLPHASFVSVSPAVVLFTLSALSSLDDPVRIDALSTLDLLLSHIPAELTRGFDPYRPTVDVAEDAPTGTKVVAALLGLLKIRSAALAAASGTFTAASAASDLSPPARLAVLKTLARFLAAAERRADSAADGPDGGGGGGGGDEPWFLAGAFDSPEAYADWLAGVQPRPRVRVVPVVPAPASGSATSAAVEHFDAAFSALGAEQGVLGPVGLFGLLTPPASPAPTAAASTSTAVPANANGQQQPTLLQLLHPTILSSFLDSAPTAFAPSLVAVQASGSSATLHADTVHAVLSVSRALFARELGVAAGSSVGAGAAEGVQASARGKRDARKMLLALLGHAAPYFPFGGDALVSPAASGSAGSRAEAAAKEERWMELNLAFAELSSLLVLSTSASAAEERGLRGGAKGKGKGKGKKAGKVAAAESSRDKVEDVVLERVQEWVVQALRGELTSPSHPLGLALPARAFSSLRPTLWSLLNQPSAAQAGDVFAAIVDYFARASAAGGGEAKKASGEFVAWAVLIHSCPSYLAPFSLSALASQLAGLSPREQSANALSKWLAQLPRWLWELGTQREAETEMVVTTLLKLVQQAPKGLFPSTTLVGLAPTLGPFFHLSHPSRGSMPGPFTKLSPSVQARALDLAALLVGLDGVDGEATKPLRGAVGRAVRTKGVEEGVRIRWQGLGL